MLRSSFIPLTTEVSAQIGYLSMFGPTSSVDIGLIDISTYQPKDRKDKERAIELDQQPLFGSWFPKTIP